MTKHAKQRSVKYVRPADPSRLVVEEIGRKADAAQQAGEIPREVSLDMIYQQNIEIMKQLAYLSRK